jgi:flavorubredoxin
MTVRSEEEYLMDKNYETFRIPLGMVNMFVIKGESIILVDTGHAKHGEKIVTELEKTEKVLVIGATRYLGLYVIRAL